ncbi:hypothetical protein B0T22DRAFT_235861 [Podospora appendiculata]|uniref:Urease accessory protein UreF-like n=1 Tax=Podospora appendiculata TaxID=314037 RepID=A0AAE0X6P0_9PEZI|nr:hypothetical protein B0T22DRAFT_235861 [Podospora appendiculata]
MVSFLTPVVDEAAPDADAESIEQEIADLERRLAKAKAKRQPAAHLNSSHDAHAYTSAEPSQLPATNRTANHFLLLLSDSALPLGSFAFSSGLESYLAHAKVSDSSTAPSLSAFLPLSISSYAATTLPFVLAAHRDPSRLSALDDALDATIICTVGRRASVAQGRALLSIWDRSFASALPPSAEATLRPFLALLKQPPSPSPLQSTPPLVSAHLGPLFGALARLAGLSLEQTAYVFLLGHVKALVSAAVRAGMFGPYQAQKTLAGAAVQELIAAMVAREWDTPVERVGQSVPVMDLWVGRHELLYSRIFNS